MLAPGGSVLARAQGGLGWHEETSCSIAVPDFGYKPLRIWRRWQTMGNFDRRKSRKMMQRSAQAAKKAREKRQGEAVHQARAAAATPKKRSSRAAS